MIKENGKLHELIILELLLKEEPRSEGDLDMYSLTFDDKF